jgi:hypothetical protein
MTEIGMKTFEKSRIVANPMPMIEKKQAFITNFNQNYY